MAFLKTVIASRDKRARLSVFNVFFISEIIVLHVSCVCMIAVSTPFSLDCA